MEKFLKTFFSALTSAISIKVFLHLDEANINMLVSLLLAVSLAITITKTLEYIVFEKLLQFRFVRVLIDPCSGVEGYWFEEMDDFPEFPFGLLNISYNRASKKYLLDGLVFNKDNKLKATIKAEELLIKPKNNHIIYHYNTRRLTQNTNSTYGTAKIDVISDTTNGYTRARGEFIDSDKKVISFRLKKLTSKDFNQFIKKKKIDSHEDENELAVACYLSTKKSVE